MDALDGFCLKFQLAKNMSLPRTKARNFCEFAFSAPIVGLDTRTRSYFNGALKSPANTSMSLRGVLLHNEVRDA